MAKRICVFCSSSSGLDPLFFAEAERFCEGLANRGWELAYGAATAGLMGHFADEAIKRGVPVRGSTPACLVKGAEGVHPGLTETAIVSDLFERKRWMFERSDAFAVFPGGFGTFDEALEAITWKLLGELPKPIVFVNLKGYWQTLLRSFEEVVRAGAAKPSALQAFEVVGSVEAAFQSFDRAFAQA